MVAVCAPARPISLPKRPARIRTTRGANAIVSRIESERLIGSTLHAVDFGDIDRAAIAEQQDQDRQADSGFRRGHGKDEEHEDLAADIAEEAREGHEVGVHRQEHQLDRHQQHDHVLAVDEESGDRDTEEDRAEDDVMGKRDHLAFSCVGSTTGAGAGLTEAIFSLATLITRTRSVACTSTCCAADWWRTPVRWRRVRATAATIPTVSISAAIANGSRNSVYRASPSHATFELPAGLGPS